ncbi:MAG TPA: heavy metal translocating P-type ATPase [Rhizomicrobium sp.]|nr:heavy metal translocating P-type ATPase [Rhizomicrobium sp.]
MATLTLSRAAPENADDLSALVRRDSSGADAFEVAVKGARCASCIAKIEQGVGAIPGVEQARLNLSSGKLAVLSRKVPPQAILRRVRDLGYEAQPFEAAETLAAEKAEGRLLLRCLAVSGFATVFAMGLTDAVWYGGGDLADSTRQMFFWLTGAVAIPASLYAGRPFFFSAWRGIAARRASMDLPISLALLLALGLSIYQTAQGGQQTYFDAAVMLVFLLLVGRYLDYRLRDRARDAARHLLALQSLLARRMGPDGTVHTVAAREVAAGDRLLLASGDRVPVNGILEDRATDFDMSLVTGESLPQIMTAGAAVPAGAIVTGPAVTLRATANVENSLVADLARLLEAGQQAKSVYVRLADRAARAYVPAVFTLSLLACAGWLAVGATPAQAITNAITVLIITCPCALGLAVPAVQIVATERLFKRGVFVKSGDALERLAQIDMAIFDKTGTLTAGAPMLRNAQEVPAEMLERAARLARASRHPLAQAIAAAAGTGAVAPDAREVAGSGLECGSGDDVERLGSAAWCGVDPDVHQLWYRQGRQAPFGFELEDELRPDAAAMIQGLQQRDIRVEILSGDNAPIVGKIAARVGITDWGAGVTPQQKAARLQSLSAQGYRVLMVGDGINDAAAMALAHVSIAPGTATDISQRASDMVLRGNDLMPVLEAYDVARKARRLVLQNFALAVIYNLTAIPMAALGLVTPLIAASTMAGSSMLVTFNALRLAAGKAR